jgi:hypothetical protein
MFDRSMPVSVYRSVGSADMAEPVLSGSATPLGRRAFIAGTAGTAGVVAATALSRTASAAVPSGASY